MCDYCNSYQPPPRSAKELLTEAEALQKKRKEKVDAESIPWGDGKI